MTTFSLTPSELLVIVPFFSGNDALVTRNGTPPFGGVKLSCADLAGADLIGADLAGVNLAGVNLAGADLTRADLRGANLTNANLFGAGLSMADLTWATLTGANLRGANLADANLTGSDLTGANLARTILARTILAGVKGIVILYIHGMSSRGDSLYAVAGATVMFKAGCFWGDAEALRTAVAADKGDSESALLYLAAIDLALTALGAS